MKIEGLTSDEAYSLAVFLIEKTGCQAVLSDGETQQFGVTRNRRLLSIAASAMPLETIVITYGAAQLVPGIQEFTKAIGKKAGEAVGEFLVEWFDTKFSRGNRMSTSATILDPDGKPIVRIKC